MRFQWRSPPTPHPPPPRVAVRLADLPGLFFGGTVAGEGRMVLSEPVRYRLRLDATEVRLEEIARYHNLSKTSRVEGTAQASLRLETVPDSSGRFILDGAG